MPTAYAAMTSEVPGRDGGRRRRLRASPTTRPRTASSWSSTAWPPGPRPSGRSRQMLEEAFRVRGEAIRDMQVFAVEHTVERAAARSPRSRCWRTRTSSSRDVAAAPGGCVRSPPLHRLRAPRSRTPGSSSSASPSRAGSICRKGADTGPRDLRLASDSIETYSPGLERDLEDLALADIGDCELPATALPARAARRAPARRSPRWWRPGLLPFMLGGDHTATVPVIEALAPAFPELRILQLDAHPDTREEFLGERYNYASAMARVMDVVAPERVYQVGMRTGSREEYRAAGAALLPGARRPPGGGVREPRARARRPPALRDDRRRRARPGRGAGHRLAGARAGCGCPSWSRSSGC